MAWYPPLNSFLVLKFLDKLIMKGFTFILGSNFILYALETLEIPLIYPLKEMLTQLDPKLWGRRFWELTAQKFKFFFLDKSGTSQYLLRH